MIERVYLESYPATTKQKQELGINSQSNNRTTVQLQYNTPFRETYRMRHEIEMRKGCSKICPINVGLACTFGKKEAVTTGAENINGVVARQIRQAHWQYRLALTEYTGASAEMCVAIFFIHGVHSSVR